jgi:translation elongation factor EF-G
MLMHANKREDVESASAGRSFIGGMKNVTTGDTISDENKQIILESMEFPGSGRARCGRTENSSGSGQNGHCA